MGSSWFIGLMFGALRPGGVGKPGGVGLRAASAEETPDVSRGTPEALLPLRDR